MQLRWFLVGVGGPLQGGRYEIKPRMHIGRSEQFSNGRFDVRIENPSVADRHASITLNDGVLKLVDYGSENGTFVDGEKIEAGVEVELQLGCLICIGDSLFTVETTWVEEVWSLWVKRILRLFRELPRHEKFALRLSAILFEALWFTGLSLAIISSLGINDVAFFALFLSSASLVHRLETLLEENRNLIFVHKINPLRASLNTALGILMIFLGCCLAYLVMAVTYSEQDLSVYFGFIFESMNLGNNNLFNRNFSDFSSILRHNLLVMATIGLLSFLYRSYATLLTIGWNGCVWIIVLVSLTKRAVNVLSLDPVIASLKVIISVSPHLIIEGAAYILVCLAAIFFSKGLTKYSLGLDVPVPTSDAALEAMKIPQNRIMINITITSLKMTAIAILALIFAAILESVYVPWMLEILTNTME